VVDHKAVLEGDKYVVHNKVANISDMVNTASYTLADVEAELGKGRLMHATCHDVWTAFQLQWDKAEHEPMQD
jgi:hypothetical protein